MQDENDIWNPRTCLWVGARFNIFSSGTDRLLLVEEADTHLFEGTIYVEILEAVANGIFWGDLYNRLLNKYSAAAISTAVNELRIRNVFRHKAPQSNREIESFWEGVGSEPGRRRIAWKNYCPQGRRALEQALEANDLLVSDEPPVLLVTTDDYLRPELLEVSREARPWLVAKPVGHRFWLGPLFVPGKSVCWECLAFWLKMNQWQQASVFGLSHENYVPQASFAALPSTLAAAAGMIATAMTIMAARGGYPELECHHFIRHEDPATVSQ